jgi:SAM-dependent methyltransferase
MLGLYGRHYFARYRTIADLIPDRSTVLDVCCGPAVLYTRYLKQKGVTYTGLDLSKPFIDRLNRSGGRGLVWDVREDNALPSADYIVMQASLCHFLPDAQPVLERLLQATGRQTILAEPVVNLATHHSPLLSAIAKRWTDPGNGQSTQRFNERTLDELMGRYQPLITRQFLIPGGREKVYVLEPVPNGSASPDTNPVVR